MQYRFRTKPWPHQVKAFKFVMRRMATHGNAGLQVPMRWGKTKVAIDVASALHMKYDITRVLAVTTTSGLGVWENEIPKHSPLPVRVINYRGEVVHQDEGYKVEWLVIHHAVLYGRDYSFGESSREWTPGPNAYVERFKPELIIIDESHKIGDPESMQCKMAYRYGKNARFRMTLTGTAFHRGPLKVFGQMKFLDDGVFGTAMTPFKTQFIKYGGYGGYKIVGYKNLKMMSAKLKEALFIQRRVPLKGLVVTTTPVSMEECRPVYKEMEKESAIEIKGHAILAEIILTRHLRLQQIAGGWVKDPEGGYHRVGSEKRRALEDKLKVYMEEEIGNVIIGCSFIPELKDVALAAKTAGYRVLVIHGGVPRGRERDRRIEAFRTSTSPTVMVCQVQTAAEAIDLSVSRATIWYSIPHSYVLYDQFNSRMEKYRDTRTLILDHMLMKGSMDEVSYAAMQLKIDVAKYLITKPEHVERIAQADDDRAWAVDRFRVIP